MNRATGPRQAPEAEKLKTRFLNQVDEGRNPKTRANVGQLIVKYFEVVDVDVLTLRGYRSKYEDGIHYVLLNTHIGVTGNSGAPMLTTRSTDGQVVAHGQMVGWDPPSQPETEFMNLTTISGYVHASLMVVN